MRFIALRAVLLAFSVYTLTVMWQHGPLGFVTLAWREAWAMQMLIDLSIMLVLFGVWMWRDAKSRGLSAPLWLLVLLLGSPGPLVYLIRRRKQK